jgi:gamma-glutamyltranspeptidase/glutathione hydrolase
VEIENWVVPEVLAVLRGRGHEARRFPSAFTMRVGGIRAIERDPRSSRLSGAADPRRNGALVIVR